MNRRVVCAGALLSAALLATVGGAFAAGLSLGLEGYTVDLAGPFAKVPTAAGAAFDALDDALAGFGVSPADRAEIRAGFDEGLAEVEDALDDTPTLLPIPLLGGSIEIPLPLVVIDGVRLSGRFVTDGFVRGIAEVAGFPIPSPIVDIAFDAGGVDGSVEADLTFASWMIRTELAKRLDVLVAALDFAVGVHLIGGTLTPSVEVEVPPELEAGVAAALGALHLDGLSWSAFGVHASIGAEIGPPFLRLGATARFLLPITSSSGWWGIAVGGVGGSVGVTIRF